LPGSRIEQPADLGRPGKPGNLGERRGSG
jgi:hypothetical protein